MIIAKRCSAALTCLFLLAACAAPVSYAPPVTGKTATLTVTSTVKSGSVIVSTFADAETCSGEQIIASSLKSGTANITSKTRIPADRPFSLWVKQFVPGKQCFIVVTFDPAHTRSYEAVLDRDATTCGIRLFDISGPTPIAEPSTRKRILSPSLMSGSFCQPGAAAREDGNTAERGEGQGARRDGRVTMEDLKALLPAE